MTTLTADAIVPLADAPRHLDGLTELMARHDIEVTREGDSYLGRFPSGSARLAARDDRVEMRIEAPDAISLNGIKLELRGGLSYVCGQELDVAWSGDAGAPTRLSKLCMLTVLSTETVTPHMRRITFTGDNLVRFAEGANLHMRLAFPAEGSRELVVPMVDGGGRLVWPDGAEMPQMRKYTVRTVDLARGTVAVDFVLHDDAGPGARFAGRAKSGDVVAMIGPGGLTARPADWYLLAGDDTALPAIGRILEGLPASARGVALVEVADAGEEQSLAKPDGVALHWLHRNGAAPGTTTLLIDAVRSVTFPEDDSSVFAWAAGEFGAFKAIRSYLRKERGLKTDQHLVVSYWREGKTEDEMETAADR